MPTCKCCSKEYEDDEDFMEQYGKNIGPDGVASMGFGSRHDMSVYQFTLIPGWYCYDCLDKEVDEDLCQPIRIFTGW